jgi:diguanylate cyclase (GGDEF)-like protein
LLTHVDCDGRNLCLEGCPLAATLADGQPREADVYLHHKNGHRVPVQVRVEPIRDEDGLIIGAVEVFSDNSQAEQQQRQIERLERLALLDPLTELANRRGVEQTLQSRLDDHRRYGWQCGVIMADIDLFKKVNDDHGHAVGDRVLQMVARTLRHAVRGGDMVGRWGGEEFIALVNCDDDRELHETAERLRVLVEQSYTHVGESLITVTLSIGATMARPEDTVESLVARADDRLYQSKQTGRNRVTIAA